jgi:hypothetical protein
MSTKENMDAVVQSLADKGLSLIGNRGIIVIVWGGEETPSYRANIKPELVPAILRALADKLAPLEKDGTYSYIVKPDGSRTVIPKDVG